MPRLLSSSNFPDRLANVYVETVDIPITNNLRLSSSKYKSTIRVKFGPVDTCISNVLFISYFKDTETANVDCWCDKMPFLTDFGISSSGSQAIMWTQLQIFQSTKFDIFFG